MKRALVALTLAAAVASTSAAAQLGVGPWRPTHGADIKPNVAYNGQFTFVRLRYGPPIPYQSQRIPWSHDYPDGERHFMQILDEVTYLRPKVEETSILGLDEAALGRHPVAYMAEPGFWSVTEAEAAAFRAYLLKGGFVIFDDFRDPPRGGGGWPNFEYNMNRVLPGVKFFDMDISDPIFHSFYEIDSFDIVPQYYDYNRPVFRGIYEDNDPHKRLMAIINFNTDISNFWEFSGQGYFAVDLGNQAFKLGVNYVMYGLMH